MRSKKSGATARNWRQRYIMSNNMFIVQQALSIWRHKLCIPLCEPINLIRYINIVCVQAGETSISKLMGPEMQVVFLLFTWSKQENKGNKNGGLNLGESSWNNLVSIKELMASANELILKNHVLYLRVPLLKLPGYCLSSSEILMLFRQMY